MTLTDLTNGERALRPPFTLSCGGQPLRIERVLRWLPGRRLTALGRFAGGGHQGRSLVIKLFVGRGARRYCKRERKGVSLLMQSGVPTPRLLEELAAPEVPGWALLFEYLADAQPISPGLGSAAEAQAAMAVRSLALLHCQGLTQGDAHLDNFILSGNRVHMVDGDRVRRHGFNSKRAGIKGLAEFLAQYPPMADAHLPQLVACYQQARGWSAGAFRLQRAQRLLLAARQRRIRRYLHKTERPCTEFAVQRNWRRRCLLRRCWLDSLPAAANQFLLDPEAALAQAERIKEGNSATVFRLQIGGQALVVKRYNIKGPWHRVRRWFKRRPLIAWRNGHWLRLLRIPTAETLALIERRWGPLVGKCYLAIQDKGGLDLATETRTAGWHPGRLDQLVDLFHRLAAAGICHKDAKATNFLIQDDQVYLIDLDGLGPLKDASADVRRFLDNFEGELRTEASARFCEAGLIRL